MKKLIISLMLAGLFPASGAAQSSIMGRATAQVSSTPSCRARACPELVEGTLDLRAYPNVGENEEIGMFTTNFGGFIQNNTITGCDNGFCASGDDGNQTRINAHF